MKRLVKFLCLILSLIVVMGCVFGCTVEVKENASSGTTPTKTQDEEGDDNGYYDSQGYWHSSNDGSFSGQTVAWETRGVPEGISHTSINALRDDKFQAGINLLGTSTATQNRDVIGYLDYEGTALVKGNDTGLSRKETHNRQRAWEITQWASRQNLSENPTLKVEGKNYIYSNRYKTVRLNPEEGSATLRINGGEEYDYKPKAISDWVHLLLEQYPNRYYMSQLKEDQKTGKKNSINAYVDFTVDEITNQFKSGVYNQGAHAAQLVWYFILCSDKGGTLWFGIPLYDNRNEENNYQSGEGFYFDKGTNMVIYSVDSYFYLGRTGAKAHFKDGVECKDESEYHKKCVIPLYDSIKFCVEESVKVGTLAAGTTVDDCWLDTMNIGFELPGTFDCQVTFNHIGLYVDLAENK